MEPLSSLPISLHPNIPLARMESLTTPFLPSFFPSPSRKPRPRSLDPSQSPVPIRALDSPDPWTLSDGNGGRASSKPYRRRPRKPLSDDDARRIIHAKAQYLSRLRRNQGSGAQTPRWVRRTPEQMVRYIEDDRDGHLYGRHVVAAIKAVRALAGRPEGSYDMREVMGSFVAKLSFREMCVVLKEQRGWRQVRDFFAWMKLQLCYRPSVIVYTIVLKIYGQIGKIKLAEEIFLEMLEAGCEPDEVACGTMLCAYARWGRHKDMMLFYSAVRRRDIIPPVAVFNFMLSSLQKQKLHGKVIQLWKQMLDAGVGPNCFTYTIAVNSYAKEELMEDALDTFEKMKKCRFVPEEVTYSLLIRLTAKYGKGDVALRLYEEMKSFGIIPSNYTCASLLALHYKNAEYSKALSLFSEMERSEIVLDEVIYGLLIRIYGKLGLYEDAQRTFREIEEANLLSNEKTYVAMAQVHLSVGHHGKALKTIELMTSRNVELSNFTRSALLRCYVANEDVGSAETTFQTLLNDGHPDAVCCNDLLTLYVKLGLLEKAKALILQIRRDGLQFDEDLYRTVMGVYCREGMVDDAEQLVQEMENNGLSMDKTIKTSLMAMYGEAGGLKKAEYYLQTLEKPDTKALSVMLCLYLENDETLKANGVLQSILETPGGLSVVSHLISKFAREGSLVEAESLYRLMIELGFRPEESAIASVITLYGQRQLLNEAQEVFNSVSESLKNGGAVYHSIIDAYCRCGNINEANQLYRDMVDEGYTRDAVTISILVKALTKHGKYEEAESIIHESFDDDVELDTVAYNTYIKAMLDSGKLHSAISIYDRMIMSGITPSLQTYNTMISVYGQKGKLDKAIQMFDTAVHLGISIDEKAYANMISYYGKAGRSQEASLLFDKMKGDGIKPGKVYGALKLRDAVQLISIAWVYVHAYDSLINTCISYNTMINAYAISGLHHEAEYLFKDMQKDGHFPDSLTYLALVRAYTERQKYSEAEAAIHRMLKEGINPSCAHFNHLVFAFIKEGSIVDAERVYNQMTQTGLRPDLACCRTMMRAYMDYGLVNEGMFFFETIDKFVKPDGFILSAAIHLYESAGKESEAGNILGTMNKHGLLFLRNLRIGSKSRTAEIIK